MKNQLKYPAERDRIKSLMYNLITYLNTEFFQLEFSDEEKINFLKEEIGFTDEEIEQLDIVNICLAEKVSDYYS